MKCIGNINEEGGDTHLVSVSIDAANISNALVMLPRFLVLSTSSS